MRFNRNSLVAFLLGAMIFSVAVDRVAAGKPYLKLHTTLTIPEFNAKIKLFKEMKPAPLASLTTSKLTMRRGKDTSVFEICLPRDIWLKDNIAGIWRNKLCTVTIYRLALPIPKDIPRIYKSSIKVDAYRKWKESKAASKLNMNDAEIAEWLSYATGLKVSDTPKPVKKNAPKKATTKRFLVDGSAADNEFIYLVANTYAPDEPFVIRYSLNDNEKHDKDVKAVAGSLASLTLSPPKKSANTKSKERVLSKHIQKTKRSAEYIASRERALNSIKLMKGWWYFETTNFLILANIKNKKTAKTLADSLEQCRGAFEKFYPPAKPFDAASVARLFQNRDEYISYVGKQYAWSGGLWMPSKKELVVSPVDWGTRANIRKLLVNTTHHESFHMYIYFACGEKAPAVWFNEGSATFFEGLEFKGAKIAIKPTRRLATVVKIAEKSNIQNLLDMSYQTFYGGQKTNNYALAWGLLYFLWKGAPVMRDGNNYAEIPRKYYQALLETGDAAKATKIAWKDVDMEKFTAAFRKFWGSRSLIRKAESYDPLRKRKPTSK